MIEIDSEAVCPVCERFVYLSPRCMCTGQSLRAEIERLRDALTCAEPSCRSVIEGQQAEIERLRAEVQKLKVHAANLESALANPSPEDIGMVEVGINSPHNYTVFDMADHGRTPIKYGVPLWRFPDE